MGSSKRISSQEFFYLMLVFQQGGIFWLLPYFLVRENGTIGLSALFSGAAAAVVIILVCRFWGTRGPESGFVTALKQHRKIGGTIVGILFFLFYLLFAIVMLYSFVDVTQKQLLEHTPQWMICATALVLVGWMSRNGLEHIARMTVWCLGALFLMLAVSIAGSVKLFSIEQALPLFVKNPVQMQEGCLHSIFCYSGFLTLFMMYPSRNTTQPVTKKLILSVSLGVLLLLVWTVYALGIFGEYSLQTVLWIPVQLARMVQISALLEQTESLFVVLWMVIALTGSGLLFWCASESLHQLLCKQKSARIHWGLAGIILLCMIQIGSTMRLLQIELFLAKSISLLLPLLLLAVVLLTPKRRNGA